MKFVNLAQRPFLNTRPLARVVMLLWLLGALLLAYNLWLFWGHLAGSSTAGTRLADIGAELDRVDSQYEELENQSQALQLRSQNSQVAFLNQLIAMRTFPWSQLFEDLEEVLPLDVRLINVQPDVQRSEDLGRLLSGTASRRRSSRQTSGRRRRVEITDGASYGTVRLQIQGEAKSEEAMLDFWQGLFDSPLFSAPEPTRDGVQRDNVLIFTMAVNYLTEEPQSPPSGAPDAVAQQLGVADEAVAGEAMKDAERVASRTPAGAPDAPAEMVPVEVSAGVVVTSQSAPGTAESTPSPSVGAEDDAMKRFKERIAGASRAERSPSPGPSTGRQAIRQRASTTPERAPAASTGSPRSQPAVTLPGVLSVRPGVVGQPVAPTSTPGTAAGTTPEKPATQALPPTTPGTPPSAPSIEPLQAPASAAPRLGGLLRQPAAVVAQERSS